MVLTAMKGWCVMVQDRSKKPVRFVPKDGLDHKVTFRVSAEELKRIRIYCIEHSVSSQELLHSLMADFLDGKLDWPQD